MKKSAAYWLLTVGLILMALLTGYFLGRNSVYSPVIVSRLPAESQAPGLLDINTATLEQLQTLPGIGATLAQRIIDYRNAHGPFAKLADLTLVEGIGLDILDKITDYATIQEEQNENTGC